MAINPLEFFQVGQQLGQARSPATGPGQFIRNVLDQAQKRGLLQAQTQAQYGPAFGLAKYKSELENQNVPSYFVPSKGEPYRLPFDIPRKAQIIKAPSGGLMDLFAGSAFNTDATPEITSEDPTLIQKLMELLQQK